MNREAILEVVLDTVRGYRLAMLAKDDEVGADTQLFGRNGVLDSMGLVSVIVELEQRLSDLSGTEVSLMNDRAMSRRDNPFRTPRALADYAQAQLSGTSAG
jgi:acyl carrier protein